MGARAPDRNAGIDAVLPVEKGWRVFSLGTQRHARVAGDSAAWPGGVPDSLAWRKLTAPAGPFRPVQAVPGQRGYFHLVDAASGRLCLYDADAALLSTFALPAEFLPFPAGRAAVFRGADGAFTFLDYGSGEAWQFADRQTIDAGMTQWVPRGRVKLPAGLRGCVQPAGMTDLLCRAGDGSPLRFDGALNRIPAGLREDVRAFPLRPEWYGGDTGSGRWLLRGIAANGADPLFLFDPEQRRWVVPPLEDGALRPDAPRAP